jgi:hypothetical protein
LWDSDEDDEDIDKESLLSKGSLKTGLIKIPEPTVFKNGCPVKALLLWEDILIIGNDRGEVKVIDKISFKELAS